ncbi:MAG: methylated-DNA--[Firmicutes bacterium]|nr:methylated-DNA--[protein]-cysteine S-methyltransferase [Bacillota bacterium]
MQYTDNYDSPLGRILLTSDGKALTGLWFAGEDAQEQILQEQIPHEQCPEEQISAAGAARVFSETKQWLDGYFRGEIPDHIPQIHLEGTDFQKKVWEILLTVPYGATVSYSSIAAKIAKERGLKRMAAQAVGGAVGSNPVSLIVPCHRVIGADGSMVGYGGGLDRKVWLLRHESENLSLQE